MFKFRFNSLLGMSFGMPFKFDWQSDLMQLSGQITNVAGSIMSNKMNAEEVSEENEKAYQRNLTMWNLNNQYNTPSNQLQRLTDAGINPALAISGGVSNTATTASSPNYASTQKGQLISDGVQRAVQMLSIHNQLRLQAAQADLFKSQNQIAEEDAKLKREEAAQAAIETQRKRDYADTWKNGLGEGVVYNLETGKLELVSDNTNPDDVISPVTFGSQGNADAYFDMMHKFANLRGERSQVIANVLSETINKTKLADENVIKAVATIPIAERNLLYSEIANYIASAKKSNNEVAKNNFYMKLDLAGFELDKNSNVSKLLSDAFEKFKVDKIDGIQQLIKAVAIGGAQVVESRLSHPDRVKH